MIRGNLGQAAAQQAFNGSAGTSARRGIVAVIDGLSAALDEQDKLIAALAERLHMVVIPNPAQHTTDGIEKAPTASSAIGDVIAAERDRIAKHNARLGDLLGSLDL